MNIEKDYIENILDINCNLRNQLELMYKLIRTKLKLEINSENSRLENILNELEILKTSLSFNLQNQSNIVSKFLY
jgi:hypothetical protein